MQSPPGPERLSTPRAWLKAVAALLFVAGLGVALAIPVLRSSDASPTSRERREPRPRKNRTTVPTSPSPRPEKPSPTPTPTPTPSPSATAPEVSANRFATPYPEHCLDAVTPPSGPGLVAAYDGREVAVAPATGGGGATFRVDPPIAWSPTGDVLATGGGKLWTVEGERAGRLFAGVGGQWAWSPTANCAIQASEEGLVVSSIHGPDKLLTSIGALDFTISPDGTRVAWIHAYDDGSASLLFGNLRKGTIREGLPPVDEGTIALRGWAPDGVTVLYSIEGERPGEALLGVAGGEGPEPYSGDEVVPSSDSLSDCGSELLGVVGPSRGPNAENRLALLSAGEEPDDLTGTGFVYASPSCSADGAYAVAVRAPSDGGRRRLVLLQVGGGSESILTTGNYADEHAEWADAWSAALVVRKAPGREPEVWFLEGSTAQPIGVTLDPAVAYYGSPSWSVVLDWTATAPTGAPSG